MELTEQQIYGALGLEMPQQQEQPEAGANEQEVAEPVPESQAQTLGTEPEESTGANEQEIAEPAQQPDQQGSQAAQDEHPEDKQHQRTQQDRENAARRRRQEQQQAIQEAVEAEREKYEAQMKDFFQQAGLKNTFTGKTISSMADFTAWRDEFKQKQVEKDLKAGKLTKETLEGIISENPVIKQAQQLVENNRRQSQQAQRQAAMAQAEKEIQEISKIDPSIKTIDDLLNMDTAQAFTNYVKRGNTFVDAYRLANFDKLTAKRTAAAQQQTINNMRSKEHLTTTKQTGKGNTVIPADELAMYKAFNPTATEEQIYAYYNAHQK